MFFSILGETTTACRGSDGIISLVVIPPEEPQEFDLSDPEQRKGLVDLLVQNHNSGSIKKIEVNLSE